MCEDGALVDMVGKVGLSFGDDGELESDRMGTFGRRGCDKWDGDG